MLAKLGPRNSKQSTFGHMTKRRPTLKKKINWAVLRSDKKRSLHINYSQLPLICCFGLVVSGVWGAPGEPQHQIPSRPLRVSLTSDGNWPKSPQSPADLGFFVWFEAPKSPVADETWNEMCGFPKTKENRQCNDSS